MKRVLIFCLSLTLLGCSFVGEVGKTVWGSSTRALEKAKREGIERKYACRNEACFDAVLSLGYSEELYQPVIKKFFRVFLKNRIKNHIIVMGIPGNVDTTEVGIFFSPISNETTQVTISSLSSSAKMKVSQAVFAELEQRFNSMP
ncbi:MAG: hypothetical protein K8S27_15385 [Candidatus Omnitrophica bacterium]|nr:hypothetical protein [Candidatus Omnitrophota bacterium]